MTQKPSEYVRSGAIYFSCETGEPLLAEAVEYIGEERVVFASDFPHWDHSYPQSIHQLWDREDLPEARKRLLLADNARRLYKL